jgi:hypothetical protein
MSKSRSRDGAPFDAPVSRNRAFQRAFQESRFRRETPMARYFIDLRDRDGIVKDEEGAIFPDIEYALDEAKQSARELVQQ